MARRRRAGEERRCGGAAQVGHHCPHRMSVVQSATSSVCRSDLQACAVPSALTAALPRQPLPHRSLGTSAPALSPCQQGPGVLNKKVHSCKIKDLRAVPSREVFLRAASQRRAPLLCIHPFLETQRRRRDRWCSARLRRSAFAARARRMELAVSSPFYQPGCVTPARSRDPFTIPHLK